MALVSSKQLVAVTVAFLLFSIILIAMAAGFTKYMSTDQERAGLDVPRDHEFETGDGDLLKKNKAYDDDLWGSAEFDAMDYTPARKKPPIHN
ncbi:hypothetical protein I3842_15G131800 [Carya illinoinensis]|uniref:Uncharacterized protein n=1 Tax=Carya illinoinensis TaxID=32201 RepID=A0A922D7U3_CARIL|nr:hypothetical protein I3842_15G131800 [Carya illinoinensis]